MVSCGGQRETHLSHESVVDGDKTALRGPRIAGDLSDTTKEWRNRYESHTMQKKTSENDRVHSSRTYPPRPAIPLRNSSRNLIGSAQRIFILKHSLHNSITHT